MRATDRSTATAELILDGARSMGVPGARLADEGLAALALACGLGDEEGRIRSAAHQQAGQVLVAEREAAALLAAIDAAGLCAIVWKGLAIAARWPAGWRPAGDLDLLVPHAMLPATTALVEARGYRRAPEARAGRLRRGPTGVELLPPEGRQLLVDLHDRPFRSVGHRIDVASLLDRAVRGTVAGVPALLLDPVDELHLALVHGAKHGLRALKWRLDLIVLCAALPPPGWSVLEARARHARTERPVAAALAAIGHEAARRYATPAPIARVLARVLALSDAPISRFEGYVLELTLETGARARARMFLGVAERLLARRGGG